MYNFSQTGASRDISSALSVVCGERDEQAAEELAQSLAHEDEQPLDEDTDDKDQVREMVRPYFTETHAVVFRRAFLNESSHDIEASVDL